MTVKVLQVNKGQREAAGSPGCCVASHTEPPPGRLLASTAPPEREEERERERESSRLKKGRAALKHFFLLFLHVGSLNVI